MRVKIESDGTYAIYVVGPDETVQSSGSGTTETDCGFDPGPNTIDEPLDYSYEPYHFAVRCPPRVSRDAGNTFDCEIFDAKDPDLKLVGTTSRTINNHEDAADPQTWLSTSLAGFSRADTGKMLPVIVTTTWNLNIDE
jgi:hypothetical protein